MSEYQNESAPVDDWSEWQAAYEEKPVEVTASLARTFAEQAAAEAAQRYAVDPNAIAADVLTRAHELNAIAEQTRQAEEEARVLDRSMSAAFGADWASASGEVARRLTTDEQLQAEWNKARDAQDRLDLLEREFKVVQSQPSRRWREIASAPDHKLGL